MASVERELDPGIARLLDETARLAEASGAFAGVARRGGRVQCIAREQPEASFRIELEEERLIVSWHCPNRYISQSIEADLMWTGDDLSGLIDEELADQGYSGIPLGRVEHFRDSEKNFVFRSVIPADPRSAEAGVLVRCLLAYDAAFSELGDMKADEE